MNNTPNAAAINSLVKFAHQNAINKDFWAASQNIGLKSMLIVTELGEFFEAHRKSDLHPDEHCPEFTNEAIELADVVIRIFDLAGWLHIPLGDAIEAKMAVNEKRPVLHGKKF